MNKIKSILLVGIAMFSLALGSSALAQSTANFDSATALNNLDQIGTGLPGGSDTTGDLLLTQVSSIITTVIGFLGVIALIMVVYAGFKWMMSGGEDTKAQEARKLLINATIGLLIILASYSITSFVFNKLLDATNSVATTTGA